MRVTNQRSIDAGTPHCRILNLGRVRRSVVVVDAGAPRNTPSPHMHGYLTRDGVPPRELLRIIERAAWFADEDKGVIGRAAMEKSIRKLANESAQYIDEKYWKKLYEVAINNRKGLATHYDDDVEYLLEYMAVMEYNDGNYKRVNPLVAASKLYQDYLPNDLK